MVALFLSAPDPTSTVTDIPTEVGWGRLPPLARSAALLIKSTRDSFVKLQVGNMKFRR